jgi:hypothetical protein
MVRQHDGTGRVALALSLGDPDVAAIGTDTRVNIRVMHRILVDHARSHNASKRGDGLPRVSIDEAKEVAGSLAWIDEDLARIVELRAPYSFSRQRRISVRSGSGTEVGTAVQSGSARNTFASVSVMSSPLKACMPVSISYSTQPMPRCRCAYPPRGLAPAPGSCRQPCR